MGVAPEAGGAASLAEALALLGPAGSAELDVGQLERLAAAMTVELEARLRARDWRGLQALVKTRLELSTTLARIRPPPVPDPDADPANLAAVDELRARIERLVCDAEGEEEDPGAAPAAAS